MTPDRVIVVVPVKPLAVAKSRLNGVLEPEERTSLALNLLIRVLRAVQGVDVHGTWVVGGDSTVEQAAQAAGVTWMTEEVSGLNEVVEHRFQQILDAGKASLYLPADLPFLQPSDLGRFIRSVGDPGQVALAPDRQGMGTNGILLTGPTHFRPALGPESFRRHMAQADSLGLRVSLYYSPGLARDLDTHEDLDFYEAISPGLTADLTGRGVPI
jgi:2-phospho-L-lactate guanylyltransferase